MGFLEGTSRPNPNKFQTTLTKSMNINKTPETGGDFVYPVFAAFLFSAFFCIMIGMKMHSDLVSDEEEISRSLLAQLEHVTSVRDSLYQQTVYLTSAVDSVTLESQRHHPDVIWLARCILSETNRVEEMPYVAWVVRNRVDARYNGKDTYRDVVLDHKQFSAFNPGYPLRYHYLTKDYHDDGWRWKQALDVAREVRFAEAAENPFNENRVFYFYSEVSMPDTMPHPYWRYYYDRVIPEEDIDPRRFRFFADYEYQVGARMVNTRMVTDAEDEQGDEPTSLLRELDLLAP